MSPKERLEAVQNKLVGHGVIDVKFAFNENVNDSSIDDVRTSVAMILEAHLAGRTTTMQPIGDSHLAQSSQPVYVLKNWYIDTPGRCLPNTHDISLYNDSDIKFRANGDVYDNPKFLDGDFVHTSTIVSINVEEHTVTTRSGSCYRLVGDSADSRNTSGEFFTQANADYLQAKYNR